MRFPRIGKVNAFTLRKGDIFSKNHKREIYYGVLKAQIGDEGLILRVRNLKTRNTKQMIFSSKKRKVIVKQRRYYPIKL